MKTSTSFAAALLVVASASVIRAQPEPVRDPVPPVEKGDIVVGVREIVQFPRLEDAPKAIDANQAHARIQNLVPAPDGSADFFVNDLRGVIFRVWRQPDGSALATPYLDLRAENVGFSNVFHGNESGLAGFAFHPDFLKPGQPGYGKLYAAYSAARGTGKADYLGHEADSHESVIREWTSHDPAADRFSGDSREVFRVGQPGKNHNVGTIAFNPHAKPGEADYGQLYISFGDGKSHHDPLKTGQAPTDPLGGLIRINPLGGTNGARYSVPADNPMRGQAEAASLVWVYGLRHPQHFSWDLGGTRRMYIAEMGQDQIDEINIGEAGGNYGWSEREGTYATGMSVGGKIGPCYPKPEKDPEPYLYPVAQYDHDDGKAVGSVVVYRGSSIPQLVGKMLCADIVKGRIFYADEAELQQGKQTPLKELRLSVDGTERPLIDVTNHSGNRVDLRLGIDARGEVYLLTKSDGKIRQLMPMP